MTLAQMQKRAERVERAWVRHLVTVAREADRGYQGDGQGHHAPLPLSDETYRAIAVAVAEAVVDAQAEYCRRRFHQAYERGVPPSREWTNHLFFVRCDPWHMVVCDE